MAARIANTTPLVVDAKTNFLDLTPPHWAARGLAWALLAVFVLGTIAAVAISMPEKVTAQFTLTPVRGADPVKAIRSGIVTELLAVEGQTVAQGDLLVTLRSDSAANQTAELQTIETQLAGSGDSYLNAKRKLDSVQLTDEQEAGKPRSPSGHADCSQTPATDIDRTDERQLRKTLPRRHCQSGSVDR